MSAECSKCGSSHFTDNFKCLECKRDEEIVALKEAVSHLADEILAHREWHMKTSEATKIAMGNLDSFLLGQALDRMK